MATESGRSYDSVGRDGTLSRRIFGRQYAGVGYESSAPQLSERLYLGEQCVGRICVSDSTLESEHSAFLEEEAELQGE